MRDNERFPVLVVAGPTASGKSTLALDLAEAFGGTVINADSMQVYRELRVLTARPSPEDEARAPHRLYGVMRAEEPCSAARWREMAIEAIEEARREGRVPIVCGGTGLYLKALIDGLSPLPDVPALIRSSVRVRFAAAEAAEVHEALRKVDAAAAVRLPATDRQRLLRALEVFEATGRSIVEWQCAPPMGPPLGLEFCTILLMPPRSGLYAACDARFRRMMEEGAIEEVRYLLSLGLEPDVPAMKALGVDALLRHLKGEIELECAIAAAQQATRNYVKRQVTWFKRQIITYLQINEQYSEIFREEIFSFICGKGLTRLH
jgi:tRNA dimethylallyltransferase